VLASLILTPGLALLLAAGIPGEDDHRAEPVHFTEHLIRDKYGYAYGIAAADLDGDGHLDLVSSDTTNDLLLWFHNDGKGNFAQYVIQKDEPGWFERLAVGDIDGDGHPDVVVVKNRAGNVLWFQNPGQALTQPWRRHVISGGGLPGAYDVAVADFDGDGRLDVAASSWVTGRQFVWFHNPGKAGLAQPWPKYLIEDRLGETRTIAAADFNGDGAIDLLGTASSAPLVVWYENVRAPGKSTTWRKHVIDDRSPGPIHGHPVDLDGDGDMDVVMALGMRDAVAPRDRHQVVWYENVGKPGKGTEWHKHVIGALPFAFEAIAADLDGDGKLDVAATAWGSPGQLVWFRNPGAGYRPWPMVVIKDRWPNANQVIAADLDCDGRIDLAASAERGANEVRWWRNQGRAK
jgi:hypothetical protein